MTLVRSARVPRHQRGAADAGRRPWLQPPPVHAALLLPLRLTAVALLLRPMGEWFVRPAILAIAALMLVSPRALRLPVLWLAVALLTAIRIAADWPLADNHIYLLAYWTLAVALALTSPCVSATLASSSRLLLALAFLWAVAWKALLAPDFVDGRFFRVTMLTDPRFTEAALLVGGLTGEQLDANRDALAALPEGAELLNPPAIVEPPRFAAFAALTTWGVLVLEGAVAAAMLLPAGQGVTIARHTSLLLFCVVSYAFAPVAGFGWLLLVMGAAQCGEAERRLQSAYLLIFLVVLFYSEVPWAALLLEAVR
jgi:hypothetical protein